jgi:hypothetical protein
MAEIASHAWSVDYAKDIGDATTFSWEEHCSDKPDDRQKLRD